MSPTIPHAEQPDSARPGPRLIALHGPDESGKDTIASMIDEIIGDPNFAPCGAEPLTTVIQAFANPVKDAIAATIGIPRERVDDFKLDGGLQYWYRDGHPENANHRAMTGRAFVRQFAEGHKQLHGEDYWADQLLPRDDPIDWWANFDHADFCVITDLRFESEAERVRELGGEFWIITGRGTGQNGDFKLNPDTDKHWHIDNSGDLEHLRHQVERLLWVTKPKS